jgi:PAS domain S-box-containing protein
MLGPRPNRKLVESEPCMEQLEVPAGGTRPLEAVLERVSHMLVSSSEVDMHDVLRVIGQACGAESAYLITSDWGADGGPEALQLGTLALWHRDGPEAEARLRLAERLPRLGDGVLPLKDGKPSTAGSFTLRPTDGASGGMTVPILAEHDRFVGYLGVEHAALSEEAMADYRRVLSVVADLLSSYYSRIVAETALRESEERWRKLVGYHPDPIVITSGDTILYANEACVPLFRLERTEDLLSYSLGDFIPAERAHQVECQRTAQVLLLSRAPFEHELVCLDGEERIVESMSVAITFRGRKAVQTVLRDVTERKASEERYRNFVETISEGIWRVDLHPPVSSTSNSGLQARHILRHGVLAECNAAMLEMMGVPRTSLNPRYPIRKLFPGLPLSLFEAFVASGFRLHNYELAIQSREGPARHFAFNAVGWLHHSDLVRIWGSCTEITTRVEMERQMVAVLEEQQERIGRDLHDSVGQLLTGVRMLSENLLVRCEDNQEVQIARVAQRIHDYSRDALQRVRDICRGLDPPQLFQEPMALSLLALVNEANTYATPHCTFDSEGDTEVANRDAKLQLYRIAQEALSNALRHAQASEIDVRLRRGVGTVTLEIRDDGTGFDLERNMGRSLGLYSMQRRASSVGAEFTIESQIGSGTILRIRVPADSKTPALA